MALPWLVPDLFVRLASASPRRLALLQQVGIEPEVTPVHIDETVTPGETAHEMVTRLARKKAQSGSELDGQLCLGADTALSFKGQILGKPADAADAASMLAALSGQQHQVITGVALYRCSDGFQIWRTVTTQVWFKSLTALEIDAYVVTEEPLDKAGGYGIQAMGAFLVERIDGSYSNVVGLPLFETLEMFKAIPV
ncbi:MAG: septum formation inhibitor Maf [Magnetococcales bacterium]|nr:septum formation inhibitor Maf [Magnetococcales bacterium]